MLFSACGNKQPNEKITVEVDDTTKTTTLNENTRPDKINSAIKEEDFNTGLSLITQSDCFTCHKMNEKVVGPSFREIANRYPIKSITIDSLAENIVEGSMGNWGQIRMLPHSNVSKEDAKKMMHYIFALKDQ